MITIRQPNDLVIEITGHSTSQICASVSTITCMLHNLLEEFGETFYYKDDGDKMRFCVSDNDTSKHIMNVAISCLKDLANQYPTFVKYTQEKRHY